MKLSHFAMTALAALTLTHPIFASEPPAAAIRSAYFCRNASAIFDAGYNVMIPVPAPGLRSTARFSEMTIAGPRLISDVDVRLSRERELTRVAGRGFRLEIRRNASSEELPAHLLAEVRGRRVSEIMTCRLEIIASPGMPEPGTITCMAHWTGFNFDANVGACVRGATSGCSNPFEFETARECERSHRIN